MAIAFDAASSGTGSGVTSVTFSHTTSGSDRALTVGISFWNGTIDSATGVTYNSVAMTRIGGAVSGSDDMAEQWKLSAPATGANNVVASFDNSVQVVVGAVSFTGAHQTTASLTGTQATATGNSKTPSVNVSSATDEIVVDVTAQFGGSESPGTGQTERWDAAASFEDGAGSTETGATTTTMSWSLTGSARDWAIAGVGVKPAAGGGGGRIMASLAGAGGLAGQGGIAGEGGGLAG